MASNTAVPTTDDIEETLHNDICNENIEIMNISMIENDIIDNNNEIQKAGSESIKNRDDKGNDDNNVLSIAALT